VEDSAAGVLVLEGVSYFVGFPTGGSDKGGFLGDDFSTFVDECAVKG
jgi:hypothetical protein